MLVLRLTRIGKKKQPTFRLIVQEKTQDPWGKAKAYLGSYNPRTKAKSFKNEEIKAWIAQGAQPSSTVHNMLVESKIIEGKKIKTTSNKPKTEEKK
jgi:small subunit ribosomal protein S16